MNAPGHVLVVDDEPVVSEVVGNYLARDGHRVTRVGDGAAALDVVANDPPDLVVLDVMLPSVDGFGVLEIIRRGGATPVIMLTARTDERDRINGLDLGADDYVVKPFSPRELTARVRSVLRRTRATHGEPAIECGRIRLDPESRTVTVDEKGVEVTPRELELLGFFLRNPGRAFSRAELLDHVWRSSSEWQDPSTVTVHMRRLRTKIESDPDDPRHLLTVWGVGYRFEP